MQRVAKRSSRVINTVPSAQPSLGSIFKPRLRSLPFPSSSLQPPPRRLSYLHAIVTKAHQGLRSEAKRPRICLAGNSTLGNPSPSPASTGSARAAEIPPLSGDGCCRRHWGSSAGLERRGGPVLPPAGFTVRAHACTHPERGFPTAHPERAAAPPPRHASPPTSLLRTSS